VLYPHGFWPDLEHVLSQPQFTEKSLKIHRKPPKFRPFGLWFLSNFFPKSMRLLDALVEMVGPLRFLSFNENFNSKLTFTAEDVAVVILKLTCKVPPPKETIISGFSHIKLQMYHDVSMINTNCPPVNSYRLCLLLLLLLLSSVGAWMIGFHEKLVICRIKRLI